MKIKKLKINGVIFFVCILLNITSCANFPMNNSLKTCYLSLSSTISVSQAKERLALYLMTYRPNSIYNRFGSSTAQYYFSKNKEYFFSMHKSKRRSIGEIGFYIHSITGKIREVDNPSKLIKPNYFLFDGGNFKCIQLSPFVVENTSNIIIDKIKAKHILYAFLKENYPKILKHNHQIGQFVMLKDTKYFFPARTFYMNSGLEVGFYVDFNTGEVQIVLNLNRYWYFHDDIEMKKYARKIKNK